MMKHLCRESMNTLGDKYGDICKMHNVNKGFPEAKQKKSFFLKKFGMLFAFNTGISQEQK